MLKGEIMQGIREIVPGQGSWEDMRLKPPSADAAGESDPQGSLLILLKCGSVQCYQFHFH